MPTKTKAVKLSDVLQQVITLATAIRAYWDVELPKRHPRYPIVAEGADDGPPPPEEKTLQKLLARLPEEIVFKLALIMYLGRGDFDASDLPSRYQEVRDNFDSVSEVIFYMTAEAPLAIYLEEGMTLLRDQKIDLDTMDLTTAKTAKQRRTEP